MGEYREELGVQAKCRLFCLACGLFVCTAALYKCILCPLCEDSALPRGCVWVRDKRSRWVLLCCCHPIRVLQNNAPKWPTPSDHLLLSSSSPMYIQVPWTQRKHHIDVSMDSIGLSPLLGQWVLPREWGGPQAALPCRSALSLAGLVQCVFGVEYGYIPLKRKQSSVVLVCCT